MSKKKKKKLGGVREIFPVQMVKSFVIQLIFFNVKSLVTKLALSHVQSVSEFRGEMILTTELATYCNYF